MGQVHAQPGPMPGHWREGEPTLTCQETRCQTHNHVQAEYPDADEPRNDKAKMVTFGYQAADVVGTKSTTCMSSDTVRKGHQENNVLFLVVHFPVIFLQSHADVKEGKGQFQDPVWLTLILRAHG